MNAAQLEQYRELLARMSKTRTADAATTDELVLAVDALVEEVERLRAQLEQVQHNYEYVRQRAPWGALERLATYGAQNYNYSTDARQVQDYCDDFHPNAEQVATTPSA